jgi:dTDP-4-amino-4,6-dideoxygalactose transaminase
MPDFDMVNHIVYSKGDMNTWSNFGELHTLLETKLEQKTGKLCLPVVNGTAAIRVALQTMLGVGRRVAVPDFTHIGTLQAVIAAHMMPVLLPANPITWQIDPMILERHKNEYDAFIVVSPFGYRVDTVAYDSLAWKLKKPIVYDFAGAWGQFPRTVYPVTYSFHATKNFSCGEGGAVCFTHEDQFKRAKRLINFGILPTRDAETPLADNLKIDEIRSAVVLAHFAGYDKLLDRIENKREALRVYAEKLIPLGMSLPSNALNGHPSLCVLGGFESAEEVEQRLIARGIMAKRYYPSMAAMPGLQNVKKLGRSPDVFKTTIALPGDVTEVEGLRVCQEVQEVLREVKALKCQAW